MAQAVQTAPLFRLPPVSPAVAYGVRFAVVVSAAIWLGKAPGLVDNNATWILITVLMVAQPQTGGSLLKGLLRAVGTAAAAFTAIFLFGIGAQNPPLLMAGIFTVQVIAAYGNTGRRFQYAWFVWAFTTVIVLGDAMAGMGDVATIAFQRASMVGIGILLVFIVDSLFWPQHSEPALRASLADRARHLGAALDGAIGVRPDSAGARAAALTDRQSLAKQLALLEGARTELGVSRARADALAHVTLLLETLASRARTLATGFGPQENPEARSRETLDALDRLAGAVHEALEEVAGALAEGRALETFSADVDGSLAALETAREQADPSAALEGRAAALRDLVAVLRTLLETVSAAVRPASETGGAAGARIALDPFRVKIALRTGVAVVVALLAPVVFGWPINTLVGPTAFMAAAFNRGVAVQTLAVLSAFVAVGWLLADVAIVFVMEPLGRAPLALLYAFVVAGVFAYLGVKRPRLAMLPPFGGLVAILSVYGGPAAPTDVYGAYNTVCYLAVGFGSGWLFSRLMWPATASSLLRKRAAAQIALCAQRVGAAPELPGDAGVPPVAAFARSAAECAAQLTALHGQARHEPVERALDEERRAALIELTGDLSDAALPFEPAWSTEAAAVRSEALRPVLDALDAQDAACQQAVASVLAALRGESAAPSSDLGRARQSAEERLEELRRRPESVAGLPEAQQRALLVRIDYRRRLVSRLLRLEAWCADWQRAEAEAP
jgi:uncharacterized membrane protein YccC